MIEIEHLHWQTKDLNLSMQAPTEHCRFGHGFKQSVRFQRITEHTFTIDLETLINGQRSDLENESRRYVPI